MSESANRDARASQLLKAGNPKVFRGLGSRGDSLEPCGRVQC